MENHCVSFNLGPPINDRMVCELSDSDNKQQPEDLKPRAGFAYRGTEVRNVQTSTLNSRYSGQPRDVVWSP